MTTAVSMLMIESRYLHFHPLLVLAVVMVMKPDFCSRLRQAWKPHFDCLFLHGSATCWSRAVGVLLCAPLIRLELFGRWFDVLFFFPLG